MDIAMFGIGMFGLCVALLMLSCIILIITNFVQDGEGKRQIERGVAKVMIICAIGSVVGFGICASNISSWY